MDSVVHSQQHPGDGSPRGDLGLWAVVAALLALAVLTVLLPAGEVVAGVARWITRPRPESPPALAGGGLRLLASTVAYAVGIGLLSTAFAWPVAWTVAHAGRAGRRAAIAAACAVPLLLPNYLAYAGLNLLRAPQSSLGDFLAAQEPWATIAAAKALAVAGLTLWAWPLAALVLTPAVRSIPRELLDALELDGAGRLWPLRRTLALAAMLRGPIAVAVAAVAVVMLGSAVPLHVAQIDTFATRLWLRLSLTTEPAAAWVDAWPLMLIALAAAAAVCTRLGRADAGADGHTGAAGPSHPRRAHIVAAAAVWAVSVLLPAALFVSSLREPGATWTLRSALGMNAAFWRDAGEAVAASAATAAITGAVGAAIALLSWCALSSPGRRSAVRLIALACVGAWIAAGLSPGVLVGSALSRLWTGGMGGTLAGWVRDSSAILVLAHTARFGMVAALVGWWLAALETRTERDLRLLDGAGGVRGWYLTRFRRAGAGAVLGAGAAVAALSFHEIEAAVMVQPPGLASFPQMVLEDLHFARDARLAAAAVNLVGVGVVLAGLAGWLVVRAGPRAGGAPD